MTMESDRELEESTHLESSTGFKTRLKEAAKKVGAKLRVAAGWLLLLAMAVGVLQSVGPWAQDQYENWVGGDPYLKVWVNPAVKVYYGPGDRTYGNTLPGFFLSQAEARSAGYQSTNWWGIGYGTSARPFRTMTDLRPLDESKLSWTEDSVTLFLDNKSAWEIIDVTIWISVDAGRQRTYLLVGHAMPKSEAVLQISIGDSPNGRKWTWGFSKVRGFPP